MASKYDIVIPTIGKVAPLKDLFIFDLANRRFLIGKEFYISEGDHFQRRLMMSSIFGSILFVVIALGTSGFAVIVEAFLLLLLFALIGIMWGWTPYRDRVLSREGKLIQGRLIENDGYKKRIGSRTVMPLGPVRMARVYYAWEINGLCAFRTPDGKVISTRRRAIRNDLVNKMIIDGTPIVVLYRNPRHFKVL